MQQFNVLDRHLMIHQHHLLEASAGTGKTFSIQNIVVRLLIESKDHLTPLLIDQILVVTFTRAATRELKARIHSNLENALSSVEHWLHSHEMDEAAPDYLQAIIESGENNVKKARKRLQQALFCFDQAQIFTIHAFCARMLKQYALEGDLALHATGGEKPLSNSEILSVMRDFLRTEIHPELYSADQIEKFLSLDRGQDKLLRAVKNSADIIDLPSYTDLFKQFKRIMQELKERFGLKGEKLVSDFESQAAFYKNYSKENKAETLAKIVRFASLFDQDECSMSDFDQLVRDQLVWVLALDSSLLKKKLPDQLPLNYPGLTEELKVKLDPIVNQSGDFSILLGRLAKDFKIFLKRYQNEEEKLSPDDFLIKMNGALDQPEFLKNVQNYYRAAIIDEFQDTDSLQWTIFKRLFLPDNQNWTGYLYLVGDPKQSIYSFRQADIYTYLSAVKTLGPSHCFTLDVNYRSHPQLVKGLNSLFDAENIPSLIPLPKNNGCLTYKPVKANDFPMPLKEDSRGAVHFFIGNEKGKNLTKMEDYEREFFFPFIIQEIKQLRKDNQMAFGQFAVLVRDRHQAARLSEHFDCYAIPYTNQRRASLMESQALPAMIDLLRAVLHPKDRSAVKAALGSPLLGWYCHEIIQLNAFGVVDEKMSLLENREAASDALCFSTTPFEAVMLTIQNLRQSLIEKGFSYFFNDFLHSRWRQWPNSSDTVLERILSREKGLDFFHDLQQIADLIIENQNIEWNSAEEMILFLDQLKTWDEDDDDRLKRLQDFSRDGVKILTLHYSKGLEFDVVFALGLVNRKKNNEHLINTEIEGRRVQIPASLDADALISYYQEADAEKMRQLYVALTRAKFRLYIPLASSLPSEKIRLGEASPMDLFLARFKYIFKSYGDLYERIRQPHLNQLTDYIDREGGHHSITYEMVDKTSSNLDEEDFEKPLPPLVPPETLTFNHLSLFVTSYSGISHHHEDSALKISKEQAVPHDYCQLIKTVHTIPANAETGVLVHSLLEKVNFHDFYQIREENHVLPLIRPLIQNTIYNDWENALASLIYAALKTNLNLDGDFFCLADLQPWQLYREMPFLFSFNDSLHIPGLDVREGLIKGVIDLIFIYKNRYYILDWKTNWLGTDLEAYSPVNLEQAMHENNYFVQAKIYREALKRYLSIVISALLKNVSVESVISFLEVCQWGKALESIYTICFLRTCSKSPNQVIFERFICHFLDQSAGII